VTVAGRWPEPTVANELEAKLTVPDGFALPTLVGVGPVASASSADVVLDAQYWDTADLALVRMGVTVRRRTGESTVARWTVKVPASVDRAGLLDRREMDVDDDASSPPDAVVALVGDVLDDVTLVPSARLITRRTTVTLRDEAGGVVAEVADDDVVVHVGGVETERFREVEVEAGPVDPDGVALAAVVVALRAQGGDDADPTPKVAYALRHRLTHGSENPT